MSDRVRVSVYEFNGVPHIRLSELDSVKQSITEVRQRGVASKGIEDILLSLSNTVTTIQKVYYYSMISPSKAKLFLVNNSIDFYIEYIGSKLEEAISQIRQCIFSHGSQEDQLAVSTMIDDSPINTQTNTKQQDTDPSHRLQAIESDINLLKLLTKGNTVPYDYTEIRTRNAALNKEFKRVFRLLKLSYIE